MDTINYTDDDFLTAEEFFDALEAFRGPDIEFTHTSEQDAAYDEWLMNRKRSELRSEPLTMRSRRERRRWPSIMTITTS